MSFIERLKTRARFLESLRPKPTPNKARSPLTVFNRGIKAGLWLGLFKLLAIPLIVLCLLVTQGHPALRVTYQGNGTGGYYQCSYLAFDGLRRLPPIRGNSHCPLVILLPFHLRTLTGVFS